MDALTASVTLPMSLAFCAVVHTLAARSAKAVLWSVRPLSAGEPQAFTYERDVWRTASAGAQQVVWAIGVAGLLLWGAGLVGHAALWGVAVLALLGALALDLARWERVAVSANHLWFQRGLGQRVHQIAYENIRDVSVEERDVRFFTVRRGLKNRVCRLQVRMRDKRVVALPKTDAHGGLEAVEAVANQVRQRLRTLDDRRALARAKADGSAVAAAAGPVQGEEAELRRALRRLRQQATAPEAPPAVKLPQQS